MTSMTKDDTPEQLLAEGFARCIIEWASTTTGLLPEKERRRRNNLLGKLARNLSLATSQGDSCLLLGRTIKRYPEMRGQLLSSSVVAPSSNPGNAPLVLDEENRLYLHRYFDYECTFARRVASMKSLPPKDQERMASILDELFANDDKNEINWQKTAAALALVRQLVVISGGPGTGKTTTVASFLACLLEMDPDNRIMLAAPTGKAAARMVEAIMERAKTLKPHIQQKLPTQATTLHRLLGMRKDETGTRYHAKNPLPLDTLVIDEASMLDLAMATRLIEALPDNARLILLGDKDQLEAVETGSVFATLSARRSFSPECLAVLNAMSGSSVKPETDPSLDTEKGALTDSVVWLTRNYRFADSPGISSLSSLIRDGRIAPAVSAICSPRHASIVWHQPAENHEELSDTLLAGWYSAYFSAVRSNADISELFEQFSQFRVLCAIRKGPYGVEQINERVGRLLEEQASGQSYPSRQQRFFAGQPIIIRRNDYTLNLFNGDIGIVWPDSHTDGELAVHFIGEKGEIRSVAPSRLPDHDTAFALTVHQSQGSEFTGIALVLPSEDSMVLSRELVYTAITRARKNVHVVGSREIITRSLRKSTSRTSGLADRIREAQSSLKNA